MPLTLGPLRAVHIRRLAQPGFEFHGVPLLLAHAPDALALRLEVRVAVRVVALLPGGAVRLLGVELDDEVVLWPVAVDGDVTDGVVEGRLRDPLQRLCPAETCSYFWIATWFRNRGG